MKESSELDLIAEALLKAASSDNISVDDSVPEVLRTIREHLGMDVAFVSEFADGRRTFQYVDSATEDCSVQVGDSGPLEESYCQRVVDGRLPELIRDALLEPEALKLPATQALPVRSHLSVPIYLSDGELYGTFCCFSSSKADHTLDKRDLGMMRTFAAFTGKQIEARIKADRSRKEKISRITSVVDTKGFSIHYQPIFHLERNRITGFESLTRFNVEPRRTPDVWFGEAEEVGLSEPLEMAAIEQALLVLQHLPANVYVALNTSPKHIISGAIARVLAKAPLTRIVLEVTEHAVVTDYAELAAALTPFRRQGLRFAVDDAGAGYSNFLHILMLKPDIIKLDMGLIRGIDSNPNQRALAAAIITFAERTGSVIIAEGVETQAELETLTNLGVAKVQGYLLGKPAEISAAVKLLDTQHHRAQSTKPGHQWSPRAAFLTPSH